MSTIWVSLLISLLYFFGISATITAPSSNTGSDSGIKSLLTVNEIITSALLPAFASNALIDLFVTGTVLFPPKRILSGSNIL